MGIMARREEWGVRTGVRSEVCSGGGRGRSPGSHNAHWEEFFPLRRRKQEGASNLLNFCIDKLSS